MIEFNWWGKAGSPPDNFKTKKQLYEIGLSPKEARAYIDTLKYRLLLYDINDPDSVKPKKVLSDKQKEARRLSGIQRQLKHFLPEYKSRLNELTELSEWALNTLDKRFLLLDTETTGLDFAEVVEIAIINHNKEVLLNTLVKPLDPIPDEAIAIHGITNEMVETATSFASIHHDLYHYLIFILPPG
jgi:DNA polymerase III subunit epsilon